MYKDRIKHWGLSKYNNAAEMRAIVRKRHQRAAQNKKSIFQVRGKTVDDQEMLRYFSRKRMSISDVVAQRATSKTPEGVVCLTPLPSPISTPEPLKTPELMFSMIRDYVNGSFDAGTWIKTEQSELCYSALSGENSSIKDPLHIFNNRCIEARELHRTGSFQQAALVLDSAFALIREVLLREEPETLSYVVEQLIRAYKFGMPEIAGRTVKMITALGASLLREQHPIRRIFDCLSNIDQTDFTEAGYKCFQILSNRFESNLGAMHASSLSIRCRVSMTSSDNMRDLLHRCQATFGIYHYRTMEVHLDIVIKLYYEKQYRLAREICYEVINTAHLVQGLDDRSQAGHSIYIRARGFYILAHCHKALSENCLSLRYLREAIDLRISVWGSRDSTVRHLIVRLRAWLLESSREEEAAEAGIWWNMLANAPAELQY